MKKRYLLLILTSLLNSADYRIVKDESGLGYIYEKITPKTINSIKYMRVSPNLSKEPIMSEILTLEPHTITVIDIIPETDTSNFAEEDLVYQELIEQELTPEIDINNSIDQELIPEEEWAESLENDINNGNQEDGIESYKIEELAEQERLLQNRKKIKDLFQTIETNLTKMQKTDFKPYSDQKDFLLPEKNKELESKRLEILLDKKIKEWKKSN